MPERVEAFVESPVTGPSPRFRPATLDDVEALLRLEHECFETDRLSRRSFRWMIERGNGWLQVADENGRLFGYVLVLFHRGTSLARLYSMAVGVNTRGRGLGRQLLEAAEREALDRGAVAMRLEVRPDNATAIALYESLGYRKFAVFGDYYEDHSDALRFQKRIRRFGGEVLNPVDLYLQTTDFTCGPAALMMAMRALDPTIEYTRTLELQLWREATTIYMAAGHGGCGPHGLALAAWRRGFDVTLYVNDPTPPFTEGVRDPKKKSVLELVHADFVEQIAASGLRVVDSALGTDELVGHVEAGGLPLVLVSSYRFTRSKAPHWVVVTSADDAFVYLHDPDIDEDEDKNALDNAFVPVARSEFEGCAQFGRRGLRAAVVLYPRRR